MCIAVVTITLTSAVYILFFCYAIYGVGNGMIHLAGMVICSAYFSKVCNKFYGIICQCTLCTFKLIRYGLPKLYVKL